MPGEVGQNEAWDEPRAYDQEKSTPYYCYARFDDSWL